MYNAVINIKTEVQTKKKAQLLASELGISLSALINSYLKQLVRTKKVELSLDETPSAYLLKAIREAGQNLKQGKASPVFRTGEEAVKWLEDQGI
jgi:addiction module RelB/DinJ family antitoxin